MDGYSDIEEENYRRLVRLSKCGWCHTAGYLEALDSLEVDSSVWLAYCTKCNSNCAFSTEELLELIVDA